MTTHPLTTGPDTFGGTGADETVNGTSTTLNAGDQLDGGGGYDYLALFGPGMFDLSTLAQFTGFEQVDLVNLLGGSSSLRLRNGVALTVTVENFGGGTIWLADSAVTVTFIGSGGSSYTVNSSSGALTVAGSVYNSTFNLSDGTAEVDLAVNSANNRFFVSTGQVDIDLSIANNYNYVVIRDVRTFDRNSVFTGGTSSHWNNLLYLEGTGGELDLADLNLGNVWSLHIGGWLGSSSMTVTVDAASLSHVGAISGNSNARLQTAATELDLTDVPVSGSIAIASTNGAGTTFTVADAHTGLCVVGGLGADTLVGQGFAFTAGQRTAIFGGGSVEVIQDSSGTYFNPAVPRVLIDQIAGDGVLSEAEALSGAGLVIGGTTIAIADGSQVTVVLNGYDYGGVVGNGSWSVTVSISDVGELIDGASYHVTANASGATQGARTLVVDRAAPDQPSIASVMDDMSPLTGALIGGTSTNDSDLAVKVSLVGTGAVVGDTVRLYDGTGTSSPQGSTYVLSGTDLGLGYANVQTGPLANGTDYSLTARITDQAGNQSAVSTNSFAVTIDTTVPGGPSIVSVTDDVSPTTGVLTGGSSTNDADLTVKVSLVGTGAVVGDTVRLYDGSGTSSPLGNSYVVNVTDVGLGYADVQTGSLANGTSYVLTARITDQAGNQSAVSSNSFAVGIDTSAPVPALVIGSITTDNVVNAAEAGATVQVSGAVSGEFKAGDTVWLTVNGVVSAGQVNTGGAFSIAVPGSDLLADADRTVAGSITTVDAAGNVGMATTATPYGVDTAAPLPVLAIGSITADNVVNAAEAGGGVQVSGTVSGEFKAGDTVSLTVNGVVSTGQVDVGGAFSIAVQGSDLVADADKSVSGSVTTVDAAGNAGTATASKAYGVDTAMPVPVLTIGSVTADNVVNAAEAGSAVQVAGTVSGEFKAGDTVSLTVNGVVSTGQVDVGGAFSIAVQGSDLANDSDKSVSGSVTIVDAAGNVGTATAGKAYGVDFAAPVPVLVIGSITSDNVVNAFEAGGAVQVTGTVSGEFKAGDTVTLTVNGVVSTGQVDAVGAFSIAVQGSDLAADADKSVSGSVTTVDAAGNTGTATAGKAYGVDIAAPVPVLVIASITTDDVVNTTEAVGVVQATGTVSGEFKAGDMVSLTVNGVVSIGQLDAGGAFNIAVKGSDLAADADKSVSGSVTTVDSAGNVGTATASKAYGVDTAIPVPVLVIGSITADNVVNAPEAGGAVLVSGTVSGEFKAGDRVSLTVNGVVSNGQVDSGGAFSIAVQGSDLAADADKSVSGSIATVDAAGNAGTATASKAFGVDTAMPVPVLAIGPITADNVVNASESGGTVQVSGTVIGEFKAGDTVTLTVNGTALTGQVDAGGAFAIAVQGSDLAADADRSVLGSITTTDAAGNVGTVTASKAYGVDMAAPVPVLAIGTVTADNVINAAEAWGAVLVGGTVSGEFLAGDTVSLTVNGVVSTGRVDAAGAFRIRVQSADLIADTDLTVSGSIVATDAAGNVGIATASKSYGVDTAAPSLTMLIWSITADNVVNASEAGGTVLVHGTVLGELDVGETVSLTLNGVVSTGQVDADGGFSIGVRGSDLVADADRTAEGRITATDAAGNSRTATTAKAYEVDTSAPAPVLTIGAISADNVVNAAEAAALVMASGTVGGEFKVGDTVSIAIGGVVSTGQVDAGGAFSIAVQGGDLVADADRTAEGSITTTDAAGNTGTATTAIAYGVDTSAPAPVLTIGAITADNVVNAAESGGLVMVGGTVSGEFEAGDTVSIAVDGVVSIGQVDAGGTFSIAVQGSDLTADADHSVSGSITTVDAAGNAGTATASKAYGVDTAEPVPTLIIGPITADNVVNATEAGGAVQVSGTVSGDFKAGDTVSVTVNGVVSTGQVDASGAFSIAVQGSDLSVDADKSVSASVTTIDAAGNAGTATASKAYGVDAAAPAPVLVIGSITADNVANAAEAGGVVQVTGTVSGDFKAGDAVSLAVNGVVSTGQVDAGGAFSIAVQGSDLVADDDHSVSGGITTIDAAGNAGTATASKAYGVDTAAPAPVLAIDPITADNVVNASEAGGVVQVTGTVSGEFKAGDIVSLTASGVVSAGQVDAGGSFSIAVQGSDLAADAGKSVSGSITTVDSAGNAGTATAIRIYGVNAASPLAVLAIGAITTDNVVNASEAAGTVLVSGTVNGAFAAGDVVSLTVNGVTSTGEVDAGGAFGIAVLGSALAADAGRTVSGSVSTVDLAGNIGTATASRAYDVDIVAPVPVLSIGAITADGVVNASEAGGAVLVNGTVSGEFTAGDIVSLTVNGTVSTGALDAGGAFGIFVQGSDLAADAGRSLVGGITTVDAAGNSGTAMATRAYGVDTAPPLPVLAISPVTADGVVNAAEGGGAVLVSGMVSGDFTEGDVVSLTVDGVVSTGQVDAGGTFSIVVQGSDLVADPDRSMTVSFATVDAAGNGGSTTVAAIYGVDVAGPVPVLLIDPIASDDVVDASEAGAVVMVSGTVSGEFSEGDVVSLAVNGVVSTGQVEAGGAFGIAVQGSDLLADADRTVAGSIATVDAAGNSGAATAARAYETPSRLTVGATAGVLPEGSGTAAAFRFALVLDRASATTQTVDWSVSGSGLAPAEAADFGTAFPRGTVTFAAGETRHEVVVPVSGDSTVEPDEGFSFTLSNASAGLIVDGASVSATIRNDDLAATDDAYVVLQGQSLVIEASDGLLSNDPASPLPHSSAVSAAPQGTLQLDADGGFVYVPVPGFHGVDQLVYLVSDGAGASGSAVVSLFVVPVSIGESETLDLLSLTREQQVAAIYAAFLGRGADLDGFEFWLQEAEEGAEAPGPETSVLFADIGSSLGVSAEARALHPFLAAPVGASDGEIEAFLNGVYGNLFDRAPDADGLEYWTGEVRQTLLAGEFVGSILVDIISGAQDTAAGRDITTLMGKVAVSLAYVREQQEHDMAWAGASDIAAATALLEAVTADPASVLAGIRNAEALVEQHA